MPAVPLLASRVAADDVAPVASIPVAYNLLKRKGKPKHTDVLRRRPRLLHEQSDTPTVTRNALGQPVVTINGVDITADDITWASRRTRQNVAIAKVLSMYPWEAFQTETENGTVGGINYASFTPRWSSTMRTSLRDASARGATVHLVASTLDDALRSRYQTAQS